MVFVTKRSWQIRSLALFVLVLAVPLLNGCATLGIATTKELEATESRLDSTNRSADLRIERVENATAELNTTLSGIQATLDELSASIDSLNTSFARAKTWLETMNLDQLSNDAQQASAIAMEAEARSRTFLAHYLDWVRAQHAMLDKQIDLLESSMKNEGGGETKEPEGN